MASKRRRDVETPDTQLIEIYDDLANENEEIRLRAAHTLLSKFAQPASSSPRKIKTILQRLFRGLCSSRKAARLGFSIALTELLAQIFQYPVEERGLSHGHVLEILDKQTITAGSASGQDERDHYFGRIFGAEAIVKSCILFKPQPSLQSWRDLLQLTCDLALKKQWLRQECGWLFFTSISYLRSSNSEAEFAVAAVESLKANNLVRTPEGVAVWLEVMTCYPEAALPKHIWKHRDPLCKDEATSLSEVMKDARAKQQPDSGESYAPQGAGTWSQQLHFSWDVILRELCPPAPQDAKASSKRMSFAKFWADVVDKSLFSPSSSPERKHSGFLLLAKVVATAPPANIKDIFTTNTVLLLVNHLKVDERYLHRSATKAMQALQARAKRDPSIVSYAIQGLVLEASGLYNFDIITKTKTVAKLLSAADLSTLQVLARVVRDAIEQPQAIDEKQADAKRRAFTDILVSICARAFAMSNEDSDGTGSVTKMVLDTLIGLVYFNKSLASDGRTFQPLPSSECREYLRSRLRTCLDQSSQHPVMKTDLLRHAIHSLKAVQEQANRDHVIVEFDEKTEGIVETAWKRLIKLSKTVSRAKVASDGAKSAKLLEMLYNLTLLQLYDGDTDAPGVLQDLNDYQPSLRRNSSETNHPADSDPMLEILLSFASKPSRFFHQMGLQALRAFSGQLSRSGLHALIRVLETKESSPGTQDLFDVDESADYTMEDVDGNQLNGQSSISTTSNTETLDSDVEQLSVKSSSSDEEADEELEDDQADLEAFDAKLAAALGTRKGQDDAEAEDIEGSDEDMYEEDMDQEEMEALDQKLAEVFRSRKPTTNKKQERKDTKEAIINFKRRVLDLIDVYLRQEHLNPLALDLVLPLIKTARTTSTKQVSKRAHDILQQFCARGKGSNVPAIDDKDTSTDDILGYLKAVHEEAGLDNSGAHASACSRASILLVKVLVKARINVGNMVDVYAETRKRQLLDSNCKVQPTFFTEWNNWCITARDQLAK